MSSEQYWGKIGLSSCHCNADMYMDVTGDWQSGTCRTCKPHTLSPRGSVGAEKCVCAAGFFSQGGVCLWCAVGSYCPGDQAAYLCSDDVASQMACDSILETPSLGSTHRGQCVCKPHTGPPRCPVNRDIPITPFDAEAVNIGLLDTKFGGPSGLLQSTGTTDINNDGIDDMVFHYRGGGGDDIPETHFVSIVLGSMRYQMPGDIHLVSGILNDQFFDGKKGFQIVGVGLHRDNGAARPVTGDMDGDGLLDLVLPSAQSGALGNKLTILYGKRNANFQPVYNVLGGYDRDTRKSGSTEFST